MYLFVYMCVCVCGVFVFFFWKGINVLNLTNEVSLKVLEWIMCFQSAQHTKSPCDNSWLHDLFLVTEQKKMVNNFWGKNAFGLIGVTLARSFQHFQAVKLMFVPISMKSCKKNTVNHFINILQNLFFFKF